MIMTNCCDDYGNCRQGRDCPARVERIERVRKIGEKRSDNKRIRESVFELLAPLAGAAMMLLAFWLAALVKGAA